MRVAVVLGALLAAACAASSPSEQGSISVARSAAPAVSALRVAITLDDLGATTESAAPQLSERILQALAAQRAPATVFVNCKELRDDSLQLWQRAGATFGNHTATHLSLDAGGPDEAWWNDVTSCDQQLRNKLGQPVRFFRYPYLRYGKTAEFRAGAAEKLASLDYTIAHVTAATSEWLLASYYDEALAKPDVALADELGAAYVEHMSSSLLAAHEWARRKAGRQIAHITLAHVNRLTADRLPDVLAALRGRGWQFVSLQEALADPIYELPDAYVGGCGCSWLARIAPALTRDDDYVFGDFEAQLRERFESRVKGPR